jgi:hypothetical protein
MDTTWGQSAKTGVTNIARLSKNIPSELIWGQEDITRKTKFEKKCHCKWKKLETEINYTHHYMESPGNHEGRVAESLPVNIHSLSIQALIPYLKESEAPCSAWSGEEVRRRHSKLNQ